MKGYRQGGKDRKNDQVAGRYMNIPALHGSGRDLPKLLGRRKRSRVYNAAASSSRVPCSPLALETLRTRSATASVGPVALGRQTSPGETDTVWGMGMHCQEGGGRAGGRRDAGMLGERRGSAVQTQ